MLKLSRRSEYALMAVQHIARTRLTADEEQPERSGAASSRVSVASMARAEQIPQPLLAKVMQQLKRAGIAHSIKGVGGGYQLAKPLAHIMFLDVISPFEEQIGLVECADDGDKGCDRADCCSLREPITTLNTFLMAQLKHFTMADFIAMSAPRSGGMLQTCDTKIGAKNRREQRN